MKTMLKGLIGGLSVVALVGFAWAAPASTHGGGAGGGVSSGMHGGGFSAGMHGGGFSGGMHAGGFPGGMHGGGFPGGMGMPGAGSSGGIAMRGSPQASFGHGEGEHSWGHGWDHGHDHDRDHDGDHDRHHHHDHDGGFYFLDDPYFDYGDADVDYVAVPGDDGYWYYCSDSNSYFPYVKECVSEWERVTPYR
jgi:hypothetical protein